MPSRSGDGSSFSEMTGSSGQDAASRADYNVAILEEFAAIGDVLSAQQDAIADEAYLGRRRVWVLVGIIGLAVAALLAAATGRGREMRRRKMRRHSFS